MFSICSATYIKVLVKSLGLVLRSYLVKSFATVLLCGAVWFGCMVFLYLELFWGLLPFPKIKFKVTLAHRMLESMAFPMLQVIKSPNWPGGPLVTLKDLISRPSAEELAHNSIWLVPIVQHSPTKVWIE